MSMLRQAEAQVLSHRRPLGSTGIMVSPITVGAARWRSGDERVASVDSSLAVMQRVFSDGTVNVIDTANSYGDSEQRIGAGLRTLGGLPEGVVVQTKADRDFNTGDFSGARMRRSLEESLERLGWASLPIVYIHDPENTTWDLAMAEDGPVSALVAARDEGLIDHLGLSGGTVDVMDRYLRTGHFEALITHMRYTLVDRSADDLITVARELGVGVMNAAPYGGGLLASWPLALTRYAYGEAHPDVLAAADAMGRACADCEIPLAAAALQFSMGDARVDSTIVGILSPAELDATQELAGVSIPEALWAELDRLVPASTVWQDPRPVGNKKGTMSIHG